MQGNEKLMDIHKAAFNERSHIHLFLYPCLTSRKTSQKRVIETIYSFSEDINNNALLLLMSFWSLGDDLCYMKLGQEI